VVITPSGLRYRQDSHIRFAWSRTANRRLPACGMMRPCSAAPAVEAAADEIIGDHLS